MQGTEAHQSTAPSFVSASGLISIWVASLSLKSWYSFTKMSAACSWASFVLKPSFLATSRPSSLLRPLWKSIAVVTMASGVSLATSSMFIPPDADVTSAGPLSERSLRMAA